MYRPSQFIKKKMACPFWKSNLQHISVIQEGKKHAEVQGILIYSPAQKSLIYEQTDHPI